MKAEPGSKAVSTNTAGLLSVALPVKVEQLKHTWVNAMLIMYFFISVFILFREKQPRKRNHHSVPKTVEYG